MHTLFKKLAYILLTLAIVNISTQAVYAFSERCNEMQMSEHQSKDSNHCLSQKITEPCSCENCNCDTCITFQANTPVLPQIFLLNQSLTELTFEIRTQYNYSSRSLKLRPPIT